MKPITKRCKWNEARDASRDPAVSGGREAPSRLLRRTTITSIAVAIAALAALAPTPAAAQQTDAVDDAYFVDAGGSHSEPAPGVLENDCCPTRDPLTASLVAAPAHGQVTLNADGSFTYQNDGLGATTDSFSYQAFTAADGTSDVATVTFTVLIGGAPTADGDAYSVDVGGTLNVPAPGVLANDFDPEEDPLSAVLVSSPALASSFTFNADGSFTYVHDAQAAGSFDTFSYYATDGSASSEAVTVNVQITGAPPPGGDPTTIVITASFDEVSGVDLASQIGTIPDAGGGTIKEESLTILALNVPAVGSGPNVPPQLFELRLLSHDEAVAAHSRAQFESCHKAALIAQARPDLYRFEVVLEVTDQQVASASAELVLVEMDQGQLACSVHRVP